MTERTIAGAGGRGTRRRVAVAVGAAVGLAAFARALPAAAADEPPEVHYPPSTVRLPLILAGLGLAGGAYSIGFAVAKQSPDVPGSDALVVPVVGPWIALGQNACSRDNLDCGALLYLRGFLLAFEGIVQAGGLGLVAEGLLMKTEAPKRTGFLEVKHGDFTLRPVPLTSKQVTGLGVTGTF